ncbi:MAG: translation elongation factor 4 [Candidatus Saganbacteria bacterium]|nr:translation elongation factor 4 [Candidatus Saganbacteria bacterium]
MTKTITSKIRNFSIIAHIDHGKSTLADRLLERTGTIEKRLMREQVLDTMDLERERGISIKAKAVRLDYKAYDGNEYVLNLIDTPGHVDFTYEVSRALAACEGALLVVDATQGVEAQTLANYHLAIQNNLKIIPVINKIDLPNADPKKVKEEIKNVFGVPEDEILLASAKEGTGIDEILEAIVKKVPQPKGDTSRPLQALIFDSHYDPYRGVFSYIKIVNGKIAPNMKILLMRTNLKFEVEEVGIFKPGFKMTSELGAGEVGYFIAEIKTVGEARVGDTVTNAINPAKVALPGYKQAKPMVFCGFYPIQGEEFETLKVALSKLQLNDAALNFEGETSAALGLGFRCGFLGLLHLEIIQERLEREYKIKLIATAPNVVYKVNKTDGSTIFIENPTRLPKVQEIGCIEEPYLKVTIFTPNTYVGAVMELSGGKRGTFMNMEYLDPTRVMLTYEIPLAEVLFEFHDLLKTVSKGYASMDYEFIDYRESDLVKLDILINQEPVDALSAIVHKEKAHYIGKRLVEKLKEVIPRHLFEIPIQAAVGSKVVARETIRALRKNVTQKCYGGDVTRKRKLLEKQKAGKKRMKRIGRVDVPQEAFMAILQIR